MAPHLYIHELDANWTWWVIKKEKKADVWEGVRSGGWSWEELGGKRGKYDGDTLCVSIKFSKN